MQEIGIRSSAFPGRFGLDGLKWLRDAGFRLIELNFNHPKNGLDWTDRDAARRLRRQAEKLSLCLVAHGPDRLSVIAGDLDAQIAEYHRIMENLARYGVRAVVVHVRGDSDEMTRPPEHYENSLICLLRGLAPFCERLEMKLNVETLTAGYITSSMDLLARAVDAAGSPQLGICLDTNHLNLSEDVSFAARRAGDRLGELHLNDNHGAREEHLLPYGGVVDWDAFTTAIAEIGYGGLMVMEPSWKLGQDPATMIHRAREVADRLLEEIRSKRKAAMEADEGST